MHAVHIILHYCTTSNAAQWQALLQDAWLYHQGVLLLLFVGGYVQVIVGACQARVGVKACSASPAGPQGCHRVLIVVVVLPICCAGMRCESASKAFAARRHAVAVPACFAEQQTSRPAHTWDTQAFVLVKEVIPSTIQLILIISFAAKGERPLLSMQRRTLPIHATST
jgi:hypothetical protein